ncbi:MAG: endonuclease/exonuclease/phosphatase family protein [Phycisphaeraceae bacterium]|nr:endonuclease/exonuclease/phosphatase family protein [Phycisphaeraceae bacterium]MCW5753960.1 endonuclease/exonuclease/phosphatase family protein [Phycisphaeraceae bacterium]
MSRRIPGRSRIGGWLASIGIVTLAAWLAGRVCTDRFSWSQPLYWIPTSVAMASASLLLLAATFGCRGRHAWGRRFVLATSLIAATAWALVVEWRVFRLRGAPLQGLPVRVMHWNLAADTIDGIAGFISRFHPDIAVLCNPPMRRDEKLESALGFDARAASIGHLLILIKGEVIERRFVSLGLNAHRAGMDPARDGPGAIDHGWAAWFVASLHHAPEPLTFWVIDLPNDPTRRRMAMLADAARVLREHAFPDPDVIVGDFNTPRGSDSLSFIIGNLRESHATAGFGTGASWPRRFPLWAIDLTFVREGIDIDRSRIVIPAGGTHAVQVVDLVVPP